MVTPSQDPSVRIIEAKSPEIQQTQGPRGTTQGTGGAAQGTRGTVKIRKTQVKFSRISPHRISFRLRYRLLRGRRGGKLSKGPHKKNSRSAHRGANRNRRGRRRRRNRVLALCSGQPHPAGKGKSDLPCK